RQRRRQKRVRHLHPLQSAAVTRWLTYNGGFRSQAAAHWTLGVRRSTFGVQMTRAAGVLIVIVIWAAIYLPWLGTPELRSEEGHRVLPAVEMLDSGDFIVPHIGGQPYLAKPPLVNWKIAGAFWVTGIRNEWTARLPSALHVLAAA